MQNTIDHIELTADLIQQLTSDQAWHYRIVPTHSSDSNGGAVFYIDHSQDIKLAKQEITMLLGKEVQLKPFDPDVIQKTLATYYRKSAAGKTSEKASFELNKAEDFIDKLILEAKEYGSSDIHVEAYEESCRIRFRIDGDLVSRYALEKRDYPPLINKIKIRSNLDIAEKRLPQDGRIIFNTGDTKFDIRVSILPSLYGEKAVLRLLNKNESDVDLMKLGFGSDQLEDYLEGVKRPNGIILISGPTGSGKTTTLYSTLKLLNNDKRNIVTIEDPIEYTMEGINQVQVKDSIGLSFASTLRSFLRQDPDVIMLGEIRDGETANMAIRAALTGHLVLSTIHTNSAWGTISRIIDMGVPSYLLANTMNLSVAQRLVKLLCTSCKKEHEVLSSDFPKGFEQKNQYKRAFKAEGCEDCFYTGTKGRTAIYEVIPITEALSQKIKEEEFNIKDYIEENGITLLKDKALTLLKEGVVSVEEIYPLLINQF